MDSVDFERFETVFKSYALGSTDQWVVDGSVISRNGEPFVDLCDVDRVAVGVMSARGSTTERIVFEWPGGSEKIVFGAGFRHSRNSSWDELKRTILLRYGYYRPDGEVDLGGELYSVIFNVLFGMFGIGVGAAFVLLTIFPLDNGSDFSTMPRWLVAILATVFIASGLLRLWFASRRPKRAAEHRVDLLDPAPRFPTQPVLRGIGMVMLVAAVVIGLTYFGPLLRGKERVTVSDVGMEPRYPVDDTEWAVPDFDRIEKFDVVAVDTSGIGRSDLPLVIIRRVAAIEGQRIEGSSRWIYVDRTWYWIGADGGDEGDWVVDVPEGHVFLMADNRREALDSRDFGVVPIEAITGVIDRGVPCSILC